MTSIRKPNGSCEFDDCLSPAVGWVEAQWTIADFVRYEGCHEHLAEMADNLHQREIEGYRAWPQINMYDSWNSYGDTPL